MKFFCLIFSFYVLLLSAAPCGPDKDCQGQSAIKKEQAGKTSPKEKDCQGCSPFFTCGTCVGFIVSKPIIITVTAVSENSIKCYTAYQQPYTEKVALSIWLPPKIS